MKFVSPAPGNHSKFLVDGEAGNIECLLAAPNPDHPPVGISLICHPHPLYGGALTNKVTYSLAGAALDCGYYALRFNFRGVGQSEGSHDQGLGEAQDTVLLARWLRRQYPDLPLLLAGFSFGGYVSLRAAAEVQPQLQVSVAPPFNYFDGRERPAHPGWKSLTRPPKLQRFRRAGKLCLSACCFSRVPSGSTNKKWPRPSMTVVL